jgi:hypothetical protein
MRAVTDTSPLHYLILIGQADLLPILYGHVIVPQAVAGELLHRHTPPQVRAWIRALPSWCEIRQPSQAIPRELLRLGQGNVRPSCWPRNCGQISCSWTKTQAGKLLSRAHCLSRAP